MTETTKPVTALGKALSAKLLYNHGSRVEEPFMSWFERHRFAVDQGGAEYVGRSHLIIAIVEYLMAVHGYRLNQLLTTAPLDPTHTKWVPVAKRIEEWEAFVAGTNIDKVTQALNHLRNRALGLM